MKLEELDLTFLDMAVLPGSDVTGSGAADFSDGYTSPFGQTQMDFLSGSASPAFLDGSASPVGAASLSLLDLGVSNLSPPAPTRRPGDGTFLPPSPQNCNNILDLASSPAGFHTLNADALLASTQALLMGNTPGFSQPSSCASLVPVSTCDSLLTTAAPKSSSVKREHSVTSDEGVDGDSSGSSGEDRVKKGTRRHKKPKISELSEADAIAKRQSNRESARKSRERKRQRLDHVFVENETLKKENMELRLRLQMLTASMLMAQQTQAAAIEPFAM